MGLRHLTLTVLLAAVTLAGPGSASVAISLGEPQAVRRRPPPYIFRFPLAFQPRDHGETAAVTVRSPADASSFVKPNMLELRLHRLSDVEMEVTHAGQTLNRLVLQTELQRVQAGLEATTAWKRYQMAKARDYSQTRLEALLETALAAHHAWARVDPVAAGQPLALVAQERATLPPTGRQQAPAALVEETPLPAEAPAAATLPVVVDAAALEGELQLIRAQIQSLVRGVRPWEYEVPNVHVAQSLPITSAIAMILGGLLWAGVASLVTGYWMYRRALRRERQRRRLFAAAIQRTRQALPPSSLALARVASPPLPGIARTGQQSMAVVGHLRVRRRMRRRLHVWRRGERGGRARGPSREPPPRFTPQMAQATGVVPSELLTTVAHLRHELISLRLMLPAATSPEDLQASSPPPPCC